MDFFIPKMELTVYCTQREQVQVVVWIYSMIQVATIGSSGFIRASSTMGRLIFVLKIINTSRLMKKAQQNRYYTRLVWYNEMKQFWS